MNEKLLHYIWQYRHYNASNLQTTEGKPVHVIHPGSYNVNQGPDFIDARIHLDAATWVGSVEIHVRSTDWKSHHHSNDKNYDNVILHVVWNHDAELKLPFPTLELKSIVPKILLASYEEMLTSGKFIPCGKQLKLVSGLVWTKWKERLLIERLQEKSLYISGLLKMNNNHWEETFWWMLARNFGSKVNADSFEKIARSIPFTLLSKHRNSVFQLEALLLGQAGLLEKDCADRYAARLQEEFRFLQKKYKLPFPFAPVHFLRMRPANFPTIRMAQLASVIHQRNHLFRLVMEAAGYDEVEKLWNAIASDYWQDHYKPGDPVHGKPKQIGKDMKQNILINTVAPMLFAYGHHHNEQRFQDKALQWLEAVPPEKNRISGGFEALGVGNQSAFDSQSLIQLKKNYCDALRCLECAIGNSILGAVLK
jgi:hypothetical protein